MSMLIEVWGNHACFSRPELKSERVSYDVMTPSAARGLVALPLRHIRRVPRCGRARHEVYAFRRRRDEFLPHRHKQRVARHGGDKRG